MRALLLRRDGQYSSDAPWVHACGEDDEGYEGDSCNVTVSIRATRRGSTPAARTTRFTRATPAT